MTNKRTTRRALLFSVLSMLLCVTMLMGTTFAWFTDSVSSMNNIIKSGNLDVELYYSYDAENWDLVDEGDMIFNRNTLWEPGHTEVVYLKVKNAGSLALKYRLGVNVVSETTGTNAAGEIFKLSNYIKFGTIEGQDAKFETRDAARDAVVNGKVISAGYTKGSSLLPANEGISEEYVALVVYMPESVGNEANHKTGTVAPEITLGINLVATQMTYEEDSYDDQYDADALPCDVIATPATIDEILASAAEGTVIGLADGKYGSITLTQNGLTLVSNSAVVDFVNANGKNNCKLIGITFDAAGAQVVKDPKSNNRGVYTNVTTAEGSKGADNLQIINCTFTGTPANADVFVSIAAYDRQRSTGASNGLVVDGCTFETNAFYYIYLYYPGTSPKNGTIMITNNSFGTANASTPDAVYAGGIKNNISVIGNSFINSGVTVTPHNNASCTYALKVSVLENDFVNTTTDTATVIGLRHFYNLPKCNVLVADNTANLGMSELSAPYIDGLQYECYDIEGVAGKIKYAGTAAELQTALNEAIDGTVICITDDITGDVTATQKPDVKVTIDGGDHVFAGVITVDGKSSTYLTAGLTIKDLTFKADSISADACIRLGDGTNATRYTCNVTVEGCTFDVPGAVGVKSYTGGDKNLVITDCTATANAHSLVQAKGIDGILVEGCTVNSKNGMNFNNSDNVTVSGCTVDVKGYAVRFGESKGGVGAAEIYKIENCTLKSACDDGDAVIVLRGTADYATLTLVNTTLDGTTQITNNATGATIVK